MRSPIAACLVLVCLSLVSSLDAGYLKPIPIGIQNSNPGNIIPHNYEKWHGAVGVDAYGHAIFKTELHGFRAIKKVFKAYNRRGIDTTYKLVRRYINLKATEHERLEYCRTIKQFTGLPPHAKLSLKDKKTMLLIAKGIVRHENGMDPYEEKLYQRVFLFEE